MDVIVSLQSWCKRYNIVSSILYDIKKHNKRNPQYHFVNQCLKEIGICEENNENPNELFKHFGQWRIETDWK